jgi:hypothetical protein
MIEGVDFSFARPGAKALVAAGKHFVVRYLPYALGGATDNGKGLTAAEIREYRAAGLDIVLNFEWYAARMARGHDAGLTDARASQAAFTKLGIPDTLPVYFSADWDASTGDQAAIDAYLKAAASVLGPSRVGVYGGFNVVNRCRANGTARWFWQTYAWSAGRLSGAAHLYQYKNGQNINGSVDLTRALVPEFGQWRAVNSPPKAPEDPMGVSIKLGSTAGDPLASFGIATLKGAGHELISVATSAVVGRDMPDGYPLGLVEKGYLTKATSWGAAGDPVVTYNVDGAQAVSPMRDVTFVPLSPPPGVTPVAKVQTLDASGKVLNEFRPVTA